MIGDGFYFRIKNNSSKDLFLYIYSIDNSGEIKLLFPPEGASDMLTTGKEFNTYGNDKCNIYFFSSKSKPGKETIKIIVSENSIPAKLLVQPKVFSRGKGGGEFSPLSNIIERTAKNKPKSRNIKSFSGSVGTWTAMNFDYEIIP